MKSESIEPQNTQKCAEIYNGSREGQGKSFCVFSRCLRLKKHRIRRNAQKYIMVQERDKKKFLRISALSAVKKQQNTQKCAEIYNGSSEGQEKIFASFCVVCGQKNKFVVET